MEKVKLKPILCNTEMVRAILGNRKTVTRRVLKQQPPKDVMGTYEQMDDGSYQLKVAPYESIYDYEVKPPYQVGDILAASLGICIEGVHLYGISQTPQGD